jgi:putative restriction endonuclease
MRLRVGITDGDWHRLLAAEPDLDEVNFWQPSGGRGFRALEPGELFLFKLHSPRNFIVGGGIFAHATRLPASLAWETFGIKNGATTFAEMRERIEKYRRTRAERFEDHVIGCILLEQPFFFPESHWIPMPEDWRPGIQQGKNYDIEEPTGRKLWERLQTALAACRLESDTRVPEQPAFLSGQGEVAGLLERGPRFGEPRLVRPRLGQGSFRIVVTDVYERRCAITRERTLPALEAAHIKPYSEGGEHRVENGLLMRRDLHALFDKGYMTVTPDLKLEVSRRIRADFENGRDYYALQDRELWVPPDRSRRPEAGFLAWHNEHVFRG